MIGNEIRFWASLSWMVLRFAVEVVCMASTIYLGGLAVWMSVTKELQYPALGLLMGAALVVTGLLARPSVAKPHRTDAGPTPGMIE